uniref:TSA: Wollemia nobilis Ref_Wollemi_Transcript_28310_1253 transcribed RNA sequence n=1 Tax=Wollemia nobilis TaxID=56998 RepID=A0A0C9RGF8_9CONI
METEKWWTEETVAVVTGANRGIGLEIVRLLADQGLTVVLTARKDNQHLSQQARALLHQGNRNLVFHKLDVQSDDSVASFAEWLNNQFGGLDILINNAAVGGTEFDWDLLQKHDMDFRKIVEDPTWADGLREDYESAKECVDINYYGAKRTTKALLPLMRSSAAGPRIVNVSSCFGLLMLLRSETIGAQLSDMKNISEENIDSIISQFLEDVKRGVKVEDSIWPRKFPTYSVSKVCLNAYTRVLGRDLEGKVWVNSVHPGYVRTEMTFGSGDLSSTEGAENVVRVALFPPNGPSAQFFLEKQNHGF